MHRRKLFKDTGLLLAGALLAVAPGLADHKLEQTAKDAYEKAARFNKEFDDQLDKTVIDGLSEESRLDDGADRMKNKLEEVHDEVKQGDTKEATKELAQAMMEARAIHQAMYDHPFSPDLRALWKDLIDDINVLSLHYGLAPLTHRPMAEWR